MGTWILALIAAMVLFCMWFANKEADIYWHFVSHLLSDTHWSSSREMSAATDGTLNEAKVDLVLAQMHRTGRAERSRHGPEGRWLYRKIQPKSE